MGSWCGGSGGEHQRFRSDVEGLRAVAILLVVLYHVHAGLAPGGYVGVDVFFVISGFLITGQLVHELRTGGRMEQLSRVVDEKVKHQAATFSSVVVVSSSVTLMPSLNFTPASTSVTSSWPLNRRQRSWAASRSL